MGGARGAPAGRSPRRARHEGFRKKLPEASPLASPMRAFLARALDVPLRADLSQFGTEDLLTRDVPVVVLATMTPPTQVPRLLKITTPLIIHATVADVDRR